MMKRKNLILSTALFAATFASAQTTVINTDFTAGDGDLATVDAAWAQIINTPANAFDVTDSVGSGYATGASSLDITNGSRGVYVTGSSVDNAIGDQLSGVMEFTISRTQTNWSNEGVATIGSSMQNTNALNWGTSGFVGFSVRSRFDQGIQIGVRQDGGDVLTVVSMKDDVAGCARDSAALTSNVLRVEWDIRKTSVSNMYSAVATLINTDTLVTNKGSVIYFSKSSAWDSASSLSYAMQRDNSAYNSDADLFNISIDSLNVTQTTNAPPVLADPVVVPNSGNGFVGLAWEAIVEADKYIVTRSSSGIGGPYNEVNATITTNVYSDATVVNGSIYHYKVIATNESYAVSSTSDAVEGAPQSAATGLLIDTTFDTADGYVNGDLGSGQTAGKWKVNTNSVANAFAVDASGDGYANSLTSILVTNDASVYWGELSSNETTAVWSGTIAFKLSAANCVMKPVTNELGVASTCADISSDRVLQWGISSDVDGSDVNQDSNDAVITIRHQSDGDIDFGLNANNFAGSDLLHLKADPLGWDPNPDSDNDGLISTNDVVDLVTDLITLEWSIRKSSNADTYSSEAIATVGGVSYTGVTHQATAADLYASGLANFVLSTRSDNDGTSLIQAQIDSLTVSHTNASLTPLVEPVIASLDAGDLSMDITWSGSGEQTNFLVLRGEAAGGPYTQVGSTAGLALTDSSGLTEKTTYFYIVRAEYDSGTADSEPALARATALGAGVSWKISGDLTSGGNNTLTAVFDTGVDDLLGNNIYSGNGISGSIVPAGSDAYYNTNNFPLLYCHAQATAVPFFQTREVSPLDSMRVKAADYTAVSTMVWIEKPATEGVIDPSAKTVAVTIGAPNFSGVAAQRAIIRNGTTWYASEIDDDIISIPDVAVAKWAMLEMASASSAALMGVTGASFTSGADLGLNNITAVGYLVEDLTDSKAKNKSMTEISAVVSGTEFSAFENWAFDNGVYNADADPTADPDGDGVNNITEWGLDGNPNNENNDGEQRKIIGLDDVGNFIYIHPALASSPKPNYTVLEDGNLTVTPGFGDNSGTYTTVEGGIWVVQNAEGNMVTNNDLIAVTNIIPASDAVKFFKLEVTE